MILVMDTDVVVAALRNPTGASAALLRQVRQGQLRLAANVSLFTEYEAVCLRPEHAQAAGLTARDVGHFLNALASLVQPVAIHFMWRPQLHDPGDELVLEAAANARADVLLGFNLKHFSAAMPRFGIRLSQPGPFFRSLS